MTNDTSNGSLSVEQEEIVQLLIDTGERLEACRAEAMKLRDFRDQLLLVGREMGLSTAEMARHVGMRREQAHYAITRARAEALSEALEESTR